MRINCEISINNRQLPSHNLSGSKRGTRASLAIGKKPGKLIDTSGMYFHICTLQNKEGNKYKIHENIQAVFTRFLKEGKFTIQLKEPSLDLYVKTEENLGREFLKVLKMVIQNQNFERLPISHLNPVKQSQIEKPKVKLIINQRKDYSFTTILPYSLENLTICSVELNRIENRITKLKRLNKLDLSDNKITEITTSLAAMSSLTILNLSRNKIENISEEIFCGKIKETLRYLDLSNNNLLYLPSSIVKLIKLNTLLLKENKIATIPLTIGRLSNLKELNLSNNSLSYLPWSVFNMNLESLDIFGNPIEEKNELLKRGFSEHILSLRELSALSCINQGLKPGPSDIPYTLCNYLDKYLLCMCGKIVIESYLMGFISQSLKRFPAYTSNKAIVSSLATFCSKKCVTRFYSRN